MGLIEYYTVVLESIDHVGIDMQLVIAKVHGAVDMQCS
jgi:hypothetical protein